MQIKPWISAFRLRTLPLSASVIITGGAIAIMADVFNWKIFVLSLITTFFLQILSNLANDYGDYTAGTDNDQRVGPSRAMQSGSITKKQMIRAIMIFVLLCLVSGITLLISAFGTHQLIKILAFFLLGLLCIAAAIKYTMGKGAYGYYGLGDIAVFLFFGIIGVCGSVYLYNHEFHPLLLLPASAFGLLCTGVLNLNNLRDHVNDKACGKNTTVVNIGYRNGKIYHVFLVMLPLFLLTGFVLMFPVRWHHFLFLVVYVLFIADLVKIWKTDDPSQLDPYLKKLAIGTFLLSVLFLAGYLIH